MPEYTLEYRVITTVKETISVSSNSHREAALRFLSNYEGDDEIELVSVQGPDHKLEPRLVRIAYECAWCGTPVPFGGPSFVCDVNHERHCSEECLGGVMYGTGVERGDRGPQTW